MQPKKKIVNQKLTALYRYPKLQIDTVHSVKNCKVKNLINCDNWEMKKINSKTNNYPEALEKDATALYRCRKYPNRFTGKLAQNANSKI